jgi:hypothetical protein
MRQWHEVDPVSAEEEMGDFLYGLVRMLKPEIVVETGTYRGRTARFLGEAVYLNEFGHVWTCDTEVHIGHPAGLQRLPVTFCQCSSLELPQLLTADLVFSDSGQETRTEEWKLVKPGCVFVMHDTAVSYSADLDQHWLGKWVLSQGGLNFNAGRGFGILIKALQ